MQIKTLDTDRFFTTSPNTGEPDCICSRCHKLIEEDEVPLRVAIDQEVIYATDKETGGEVKRLNDIVNGLEFRLCEKCQMKIGIKFL